MRRKRIYYLEFKRGLDTEALKSLYLFSGAEAFLKEEGIRAIIDKALPPAERSMNFEALYAGTDVSGQELKDRALTLPFLSERRVLLVRQAEKWHAADVKAVAEYAQNPSPTTIVILSSQEERLKHADWKAFASLLYHVECYPLFDNQVPGWIEHRVSEHGKQISWDAIQLLIERTGQALADIDNEINKLVNYTGAQTRIEAEDVLAAAGYTRQNTMHELNAALGRADAGQAVRLVDRVLDEGIKPLQMLGSIAWHFRNLRAFRKRLDAGENLEDITRAIKNPQTRREMQLQAKTFSCQAFTKIFQELLKLDEHLKTGKSHWKLFLQLALWKICRKYAQG